MSAAVALGVALLLGASRPPVQDGLQSAVDGVLQDLHLSAVSGLTRGEDLAVAIRFDQHARRGDLGRVVLGLLTSGVGRKGVQPIVTLPPRDDQSLGDIDRAARKAGAEWLLLATVERLDPTRLELRAELRAVDRGLWAPVPRPETTAIHAFAARSIQVDPAVRSLVESSKRLGTAGRLVRLGRVPDRVLAMCSCSAAAPLVVLGVNTLTLYTWDRGELTESARISLTQLPAADTPSRDPIGGVACADVDADGAAEIVFGHSGLAQGHVVALTAAKPPALVRRFPGIPVGALTGRTLLFAKPDQGRNWWAPMIEIGSLAKRKAFNVGRPLLDIAVEPTARSDRRIAAVTIDYALVRMDDRLSKMKTVGTSGAGIALARGARSGLIVSTSSISARTDIARFVGSGRRAAAEIIAPAPITASTVAELRKAARLDLILALASGDATDLFAAELDP